MPYLIGKHLKHVSAFLMQFLGSLSYGQTDASLWQLTSAIRKFLTTSSIVSSIVAPIKPLLFSWVFLSKPRANKFIFTFSSIFILFNLVFQIRLKTAYSCKSLFSCCFLFPNFPNSPHVAILVGRELLANLYSSAVNDLTVVLLLIIDESER